MSTKIAPAPPPAISRVAFIPNSTQILLIPTANGANRLALPLRVSPSNESRRTLIMHPPPSNQPILDESLYQPRDETGFVEPLLSSTQQRREILKRKIQERPTKQYLIRKHILLTDPLVEPFVGEKTHQLRKQAVVSNLNRKLKSRPGPLDLVTKKILQADAELEEAIKEGRLLFPSSRRQLESPSPSIPQAPSPSVLLSSLRISKQESIREEEEARASQSFPLQADPGMMDGDESTEDQRGRKYGRVESRPQPHPYARMDATQPSPSKGRLKGPDSRSTVEYTAVPDNFEAMMKQQELFIEWRTRPMEMGAEAIPLHNPAQHSLNRPIDEGAESDSAETIPYGDDEDSITYRVYPELPAENPAEPPQITPAKVNVQRSSGQPSNYRTPIYSLNDIKKTDLMQECRKRNLKCGGDKTTIIQRLEPVKDEIVGKYKEEQARLEAATSPHVSSERALSNTSSSSSPSTIIEEIAFENGARLDESIASRRHSLPSNNPQHAIAKSIHPPSRHLSVSSGSHAVAPAHSSSGSSLGSTISFPSQQLQLSSGSQPERKIQMKTANGEIFYATLPSADDLPIPRDGKPIGCRIAIVNGKPVLQFQQPNGPIEPGSVGVAGISDTLLFAQNGSGGQVTLGPQKDRSRSSSHSRKVPFSGDCSSLSSLLRSNPSATSLPVVVTRAPQSRSQSTSSSASVTATLPSSSRMSKGPMGAPKSLAVSRKPSKSPPHTQHNQTQAQPLPVKQIIVPQSHHHSNSQSHSHQHHQPHHPHPHPHPPPHPHPQAHPHPQPQPQLQPQPQPQPQQQPQQQTQPPPQQMQPQQSQQQQPQQQTQQPVEEMAELDERLRGLTDAQKVFAHVKAINQLLDRNGRLALDAKTVLEHEQALRSQQKIIDALTKELKKSHAALKMQQQLILSAKRAQTAEIAKMTNNKLKSIGEAWLFELNMKRLNKSNSSFFLTHEQQMQELTNLTEEHKKIQRTHVAIQMSEASDSAIKDISKFIGANPKTALLIVQLLKKYQNEKNQPNPSATHAFGDIPPFEPSPKSPYAQHRATRVETVSSDEFIAINRPGSSHVIEKTIRERNPVVNSSLEAIVIDDDSQDEEALHNLLQSHQQNQPRSMDRLSLGPLSMRNRRKDARGHNIKVDMEEIFRTVLDGSKTGNFLVGSDANQNGIIIHNSPTHSISSIHSTHSLSHSAYKSSPQMTGGTSSSTSPSSSSTPPESAIHHAMRHPVHFRANNSFPTHSLPEAAMAPQRDPPIEYHHSTSYEGRPYVSEAAAPTDDNPTDILMDAMESSGIVEECSEMGEEVVPTSAHTIHEMGELAEIGEMGEMDGGGVDPFLLHPTIHEHQPPEEIGVAEDNGTGGDFSQISGTDYEAYPENSNYNDIQNVSTFHLSDPDMDDLMDVIKEDVPIESKKEQRTKEGAYNGTEELNKVLGPMWMNYDGPSTSGDLQMLLHAEQDPMDPCSSSHQAELTPSFEDVFSYSSPHGGSSQSTSPLLLLPDSVITDMSWLNEEEVRAALSPKDPFPDYDFSSPSNT